MPKTCPDALLEGFSPIEPTPELLDFYRQVADLMRRKAGEPSTAPEARDLILRFSQGCDDRAEHIERLLRDRGEHHVAEPSP
jgi:hypothetical protein